jgi:putative addiction module CopG family antidote
MTVQLRPEDEQLVQKRLQSGAFSNLDEVIHRALQTQDAEESWLAFEKEAIEGKIARGLAELESGQGLSEDQLKTRMQAAKEIWLAEHRG